jgi:hypothetical protein
MYSRNWKQPKGKIHDVQNKKGRSGRDQKGKDEMKSAVQDEKELKRKKKRLSIDWFFRPEGD